MSPAMHTGEGDEPWEYLKYYGFDEKTYDQSIAVLRARPLVDPFDNELPHPLGIGGKLDPLRAIDDSYGVMPIDIHTANHFVRLAQERLKPKNTGFNDSDWELETLNDLRGPGGSKSYVQINLELPNEVLIEAFRSHLKQVRDWKKECGILSPRNPPTKEWAKMGLLAYADLFLWAHQHNASIVNRLYADAILPVGSGGEETIRKTTKKTAEQVFDTEYLSQFFEYVSHRYTEGKL